MTSGANGLPVRDDTVLKSVRAICPRCFAENEHFDPECLNDGKVYPW